MTLPKWQIDDEGTYVNYEPEGMVDISTWSAVKFLLKLLIAVVGITWLACWVVWG